MTPGPLDEPMIVILNDNGMSIDPNVGGDVPAFVTPAQQARLLRLQKALPSGVGVLPDGAEALFRQPRRENGTEKVPASRQHPV